ncbi:MAG: Rpn family recombination-promoting nuclease/putative transposase, partial [Chromatiales bacterium]|nr:Rpn family recombination-promoting nuclease/putative transposase [Chromatiales bacterium]
MSKKMAKKTPKKTMGLKLTQDIIFKIFFSRNEQVLMSLLRSFLPIPDNISDVIILNPEAKDKDDQTPASKPTDALDCEPHAILPEKSDEKQVILDLRVRLSSGENINVEMQSVFSKYLQERILFYWTRLYSQGLKRGKDYDQVAPAYSLIFTTYSMLEKKFKGSINSFSIRSDEYPHDRLNKNLRIVTAELNKLPSDYKQLIDLREKWCYLLSHSEAITEAEYHYLSKDEELKMALEHLNRLSEDERLEQVALSRDLSEMTQYLHEKGLREEG